MWVFDCIWHAHFTMHYPSHLYLEIHFKNKEYYLKDQLKLFKNFTMHYLGNLTN